MKPADLDLQILKEDVRDLVCSMFMAKDNQHDDQIACMHPLVCASLVTYETSSKISCASMYVHG